MKKKMSVMLLWKIFLQTWSVICRLTDTGCIPVQYTPWSPVPHGTLTACGGGGSIVPGCGKNLRMRTLKMKFFLHVIKTLRCQLKPKKMILLMAVPLRGWVKGLPLLKELYIFLVLLKKTAIKLEGRGLALMTLPLRKYLICFGLP